MSTELPEVGPGRADNNMPGSYEKLRGLSDIRTTRDLDKDGVRDILRRFTRNSSLEVVEMGPLEDMSGLNDAFNSSITSMTVKTSDGDLNFVIKSPPKSRFILMMHKFTRPFYNEVTWYKDLVGLLELVNGKGCIDRMLPQCYYAYSNYYEAGGNEAWSMCCVPFKPSEKGVIVLENIKFRTQQYKMYDKRRPLDSDHVELIMRELANFHGMWLKYKFASESGFPNTDPDGPQPVPWSVFESRHNTQKRMPKAVYSKLANMAKRTVLRILAKQDDVGDEVVARCRRFFDRTAKRKLTEYLNMASQPVYTLCHGDFWSNNILFSYDGDDGSRPKDLVIIDYQLINVGNPCYDLVYFLYINTDRAFRSEHLERMLRLYYDTFSAYFEPDRIKYSYDDFKADFESFRPIGFTTACSVMPNVLSDNKVEMDGNPITAFSELQRKQEQDMDDETSESGTEIRRRIVELVKEMADDNVI